MIFFTVLVIVSVSGSFFGRIHKFQSGKNKIYLFPHSHNDVGWIKTYKEYYEMEHGVRQIIDSYMQELINDPSKHFSQTEIAFFQLWWNEQDSSMQEKVKQLVNQGQLEFLSGGWCMNDEATTYYEDIIDQMTLGHKFLLKYLNYIPTIGWQVDTFGHSNTQAMFASMMGFNAQFYGRINYKDKQRRMEKKNLEFIIHPQNQSGDHSIFTHITYYGYYSSPEGFDYDVMNPNKELYEQSEIIEKAEKLADYFYQQLQSYQGSIIAHTLGMDFEWSDSREYFAQIDQIIKIINNNPEKYNMSIVYGTPSQYIAELNEQKLNYSSQVEDFFPYQDQRFDYWTGYFTSRPILKVQIKRIGRYFQQVKKIYSLLKMNNISGNMMRYDNIQKLAEVLGTCQHHDAITGTAVQYVTDDYISMLNQATQDMEVQMNEVLNYLMNDTETQHVQCNSNEPCNAITEPLLNNKTILLTIIDTKVNNEGMLESIKLVVPENMYISIEDEYEQEVKGEIFCIDSVCTLFIQRVIEKMINFYKIKRVESQKLIKTINPKPIIITQDTILFEKFQLQFKCYYDFGGAYVFQPNYGQSRPFGAIIKSFEFQGELIKMVYIETNTTKTWIATPDNKIFYIDTFVDSVDLSNGIGKDVIIEISTRIQNKGVFYTDSNGLDLQRRQISSIEPVNEKYYPVNGIIMIRDEQSNEAVAILNDRPQGGSSLRNGQIELMLQRRLQTEDFKGVEEILNEEQIMNNKRIGMQLKITHTMVFYNYIEEPNKARSLQYQQDLKPLQYFSTLKSHNIHFNQPFNHFASFIEKDQLNLGKLYIEPWIEENEYLIRVHNMGETQIINLNYPPNLSFYETTLTGNQFLVLQQKHKLKWQEQERIDSVKYEDYEIGPMQIRTWIVRI